MFATAVPGLGAIVRQMLSGRAGVVVEASGFDGRSDVIMFVTDRGADSVTDLGLTEDIFAEVGRTLRSEGDRPGWIADRIWRPGRADRALSLWASQVRPLRAAMTFRVIARVLQERSFQRTELRRQLTKTIERDRPRWRVADPGDIEVWISEYSSGKFVAGIRLSDVRMRQHEGRAVERQGALRPTVASAMVHLAGPPAGTLLDPCCGSGTILREAMKNGWRVQGADIDPGAVEIARRNVPEAEIVAGDVRRMDRPGGDTAACVSNLPFGQQYHVQGNFSDWLEAAMSEMARVTAPGGRIVLLAPRLPRTAVPSELLSRDRFPVRLLGTKTAIWVHDRR